MKWSAGTEFEKPAPGSHLARCYGIIDLGSQRHEFQGQAHVSRDVKLCFELPFHRMTGKYFPEDKGQPFRVSTNVKQSLHPKANLRKIVEGWAGKKMSNEDVQKFDPKKLLGLPCRLALLENDRGYVNIDAVSALNAEEKAQVKAAKLVNPVVFLSLDPEEFDREVFASLSEGLREFISRSPEFAALQGGGPAKGEEPQADAPDGEAEVPF